MSTLGHQPFDNDMALDFADEIVASSNGKTLVRKACEIVVQSKDDCLDNWDCCRAIAAAEVIAAANGHGPRSIPQEVRSWIVENKFLPTRTLTRLAVMACEAILSDSESKELWENHQLWRNAIKRTIERLKREPKRPSGPMTTKAKTKKTVQNKSLPGVDAGMNQTIERIRKQIYLELRRKKPIRAILESEDVTPQTIDELIKLTPLTKLEISCPEKFPDSIFDPLGELSNLEYVTFRFDSPLAPKLKDRHLKFCQKLQNLKSLDVRGNKSLTDKTLKHLTDCINLECLFIDRAKITDAGMKYLADKSNLCCLFISNTNISDTGLKAIAGCGKLMSLSFNGSKIKGAAFKHFEAREIEYVSGVEQLTAEGKRQLRTRYVGCPVTGPDPEINWE